MVCVTQYAYFERSVLSVLLNMLILEGLCGLCYSLLRRSIVRQAECILVYVSLGGDSIDNIVTPRGTY